MVITNRHLLVIFNNIAGVKKKRLPVKLGYAINKNLLTMQDQATSYNAEREKIIDRYCKKDENGEPVLDGAQYVFPDPGSRAAYMEEMQELLEIENDLDIHMVSIEDVEKCDSDKYDALTPEELEVLTFMIDG